MKMNKFFWVIMAFIPLGIFAQEVKYVKVPTSPNESSTPAPGYYQNQNQPVSQSFTPLNELFRDTLKVSEKKAIHTTFLKNRPQDNWFLSLSAGAAVLLSEESYYRKFTDQLNFPTVGFALGKWWTPVWGLRLSATAAKLTGFAVDGYDGYNRADGLDVYDENGNRMYYFMGSWMNGKYYSNGEGMSGVQNTFTSGTTQSGGQLIANRYLNLDNRIITPKGAGYTYDITYAAASLDLMLNLKNYFTRYNPKAVFNPVLYAGVGMAHTFAEDSKEGSNDKSEYKSDGRTAVNSIMGKAGLQLNFRLSGSVDFFLDGHTLILPEFFDRRVGDGNTQDLVVNGMIGFTYKFNERYFYEPRIPQQQIYAPAAPYTDDVADRLQHIEDLLARQPEQEAPAANLKELVEHLRVVVYFIIDKWDVRQSEMYKLDEIAKFMNKYPQVRVTIQGYADVQTAYPAYNMKLSDKRANEVARILGTKYGIDQSRLRIQHFGDTVQPFDINELNRAVIAFDIPEN